MEITSESSNCQKGSALWHCFFFLVMFSLALKNVQAQTFSDGVSPTTSIMAPTAGSSAVGLVVINADACDNVVITKVEFFVDTTLIGTDSVHPYSFQWNSSSVANGNHNLTTKAYDGANNVTTSAAVSVNVNNETILPVTVISVPAAGAKLKGTVTITATATDNVSVTIVEFYVDGNFIASDTTSPYSTNWNTTFVTDGNHNLTSKASDPSGNTGTSAAIPVSVDNTMPATSITAPASGTFVRGTTTVNATATDNIGVTNVEFYLDTTLIGSDATTPYSLAWNTTTATAGNHNLSSKAFDAAGNSTTSSSVAVTVDNTSPTTSITSPTSGATITGLTTITANASDNSGIAKVEFYVDTTLIGNDTASPYSISWSSSSVTNGTHSLTSKAIDLAGNTVTSAAIGITTNNEFVAPTTSVTAPTDGSFLKGTVAVNANANDNVGVTRVEFYAGAALIGSDTTTPYSVNWNTTTTTDGSYTLTSKAFDASGNVGTSAPVGVVVDNVVPTTSITSPASGANLKSSITVSASGSDAIGVTKVEFYVDSTLITSDTTAPYSISWNTTTVTNASHSLTSKAYDQAGNIGASVAVSVNVDNISPATNITSPTSGSTVTFTINITANASDNVGLSKVEFYVDTSLISLDTSIPFGVPWNSTTVTNGNHTLTTKAYDAAGNITTSSGIQVIVNNPPVLFFDDFEDGSASDWTFTGGTWSVSSGNLTGNGVSKKALSPFAGCVACSVEGDLQTTGGATSNVSLVGWYQDSQNFVELILKVNAGQWQLIQKSGGSNVVNQSFSQSVSPNVSYRTKISFDGTNFKAYVNGNLIITAVSGASPSGTFGFGVDNTNGTFKEIVVYNESFDTTDPTTSLTLPVNGATVQGTITVAANAADNIGVSKVEFHVDGANLIGTDTTSPYSTQWATTGVANGSHSLTSKAFDAAGNSTTSSAVSVTVNNTSTFLFTDDFEDGNASNWTFTGGTWSVVTGNLTGTANNKNAIAPFAGCTVCTVEADLQTTGGANTTVSLLGWYVDTVTNVELTLKEDVDKWQFKQKSGGTTVANQTFDQPLIPNTNYPVKISFDGTNFKVFVSEVLIMTVPSGASPSGTVGFGVNSATGTFRQISVY